METKLARVIALPDGLTPEKVRGYLDRRANDVAAIRSAMNGRAEDSESRHVSREVLREIGHRIKGNATLYGLPELGHAAGELVEMVDAGDWLSITRSASRLLDRVEADKIRFQE